MGKGKRESLFLPSFLLHVGNIMTSRRGGHLCLACPFQCLYQEAQQTETSQGEHLLYSSAPVGSLLPPWTAACNSAPAVSCRSPRCPQQSTETAEGIQNRAGSRTPAMLPLLPRLELAADSLSCCDPLFSWARSDPRAIGCQTLVHVTECCGQDPQYWFPSEVERGQWHLRPSWMQGAHCFTLYTNPLPLEPTEHESKFMIASISISLLLTYSH